MVFLYFSVNSKDSDGARLISGLNPGAGSSVNVRLVAGVAGINKVAARFWEALIGEMLGCMPEADMAVLTAPVEGAMRTESLKPYVLDFSALENEERDFGELIRDIISEVEFYGPPAPVRCAFLRESEILADGLHLAEECADAGLLPFLVGWLLVAGGVPANALRGRQFDAEISMIMTAPGDPKEIRVSIALNIHEISEGLFEWALALDFSSFRGRG